MTTPVAPIPGSVASLPSSLKTTDPMDLTNFMSSLQNTIAQRKAVLDSLGASNAQGSSNLGGVNSGGGVGAGYPNVGGGPVSGNEAQWIAAAERLTGLGPQYSAGLANIIQHESGGNPNAINRWDSNAQAGHPSQGLMQTIPSTFASNAVPGHGQILNPVDNIAAAINYIKNRYGLGMILQGGRHDAAGNYIGY